ncbi:hypothetical protein LTR91_010664 [Friedmanniomyces endolithicus]|uniref:FAD/NAD(P)-binding domain-containing protein n=1 Tax=Friedmanniomyces endolithicus TaxID=329885 RepID=A0AAN6KJ39_9PEZI|nr:hypothetical protein LTR35_015086 [Friedmanniomyces endolithicus]KAK0317203.1 hypothetical protein LTR82_011804 [Friedmanniomyces endolithicus]KAK0919846.1 hypothetical protein LTR57_010284 [Friedmanniomyces endolithicus]KAK0985242.1 hypothetical protein LTR91_010664 [Friedmanniomyces endolithicus]KAK1015367.1 hypothetical protein LTR54_003910 [Friedmanniomyces endolithicus]
MGSIGEPTDSAKDLDYEVLVIGAGLSGILSLYRLRELGFRVRVFEAGSGADPGARFDSESYSYQFTFSQEVLNEWNWTEHFAGQPEILAYINFLCDKFDLRSDIQFHTKVTTAHFDQSNNSWRVTDDEGKQYTSRWLITAIGFLSAPTLPNIPGVQDFKGEAHHTSRWPQHPVKFENKRVGLIGTGATGQYSVMYVEISIIYSDSAAAGIQCIQEIAKTAGHLTVFQRTPNWAVPLHNSPISTEEMSTIRQDYPAIFDRCHRSYMNFLHMPEPLALSDVSQEQREAFWADLYDNGRGFRLWLSNYRDVAFDKDANRICSDWIADRIRQRVHDPDTAERLIPKNHGFGTKRVPMETGYYEAYNQPNVRLVDVTETPIQRINSTGIQTSKETLDLDMLIYATGFDAVTGAFDAMDIRGLDALALKDRWEGSPRTYVGMTVDGFPNMFMSMGPHQSYGNIPRSIEYAVTWITTALAHFREKDVRYVEATAEGVEMWTQHVVDAAKGSLANEVDSWMTGVNKNVAGKQKRIINRYTGSAPGFRKFCDGIAGEGYSTFKLA